MATKEGSVEVTPSANIEIRSLPSESLREEALEAIVDLGEDPTPPQAKPLRGLADYYRIAFGHRGDHRIVYKVVSRRHLVRVVRVRHRADAYDGL